MQFLSKNARAGILIPIALEPLDGGAKPALNVPAAVWDPS